MTKLWNFLSEKLLHACCAERDGCRLKTQFSTRPQNHLEVNLHKLAVSKLKRLNLSIKFRFA